METFRKDDVCAYRAFAARQDLTETALYRLAILTASVPARGGKNGTLELIVDLVVAQPNLTRWHLAALAAGARTKWVHGSGRCIDAARAVLAHPNSDDEAALRLLGDTVAVASLTGNAQLVEQHVPLVWRLLTS